MPGRNGFNAVRSIDADRLEEAATCQRAKHLNVNELKASKNNLRNV
jgi:hypothetical protein